MSTNTGVAPLRAKAFAVDTNVNDGMMISSPGAASIRIAAISSAPVQECVSSARGTSSVRSIQVWHLAVNGPLPDR